MLAQVRLRMGGKSSEKGKRECPASNKHAEVCFDNVWHKHWSVSLARQQCEDAGRRHGRRADGRSAAQASGSHRPVENGALAHVNGREPHRHLQVAVWRLQRSPGCSSAVGPAVDDTLPEATAETRKLQWRVPREKGPVRAAGPTPASYCRAAQQAPKAFRTTGSGMYMYMPEPASRLIQ